MEVVVIQKQEMEKLIAQLNLMNAKIEEGRANVQIIDNADFCQLMKISKRTAANWREKKLISYSIIGNKVYYKLKDVEALLNRKQVKAFMSRAESF